MAKLYHRNQLELLHPLPPLDLCFTSQRPAKRPECLRIHQRHRPPGLSIVRTLLGGVVLGNTTLEVVRITGIETVIGAFQDVYVVTHDCIVTKRAPGGGSAILRQGTASGRYDLERNEASLLILLEGTSDFLHQFPVFPGVGWIDAISVEILEVIGTNDKYLQRALPVTPLRKIVDDCQEVFVLPEWKTCGTFQFKSAACV